MYIYIYKWVSWISHYCWLMLVIFPINPIEDPLIPHQIHLINSRQFSSCQPMISMYHLEIYPFFNTKKNVQWNSMIKLYRNKIQINPIKSPTKPIKSPRNPINSSLIPHDKGNDGIFIYIKYWCDIKYYCRIIKLWCKYHFINMGNQY